MYHEVFYYLKPERGPVFRVRMRSLRTHVSLRLSASEHGFPSTTEADPAKPKCLLTNEAPRIRTLSWCLSWFIHSSNNERNVPAFSPYITPHHQNPVLITKVCSLNHLFCLGSQSLTRCACLLIHPACGIYTRLYKYLLNQYIYGFAVFICHKN